MISRALFFIFLLINTTLLSQKNNSNSIYGELGNYVIKNYDNVFYSFGHHHLGWTLGAISGKIISKMISNEKTNLDLKPYSSLRFS